MMISPEALAVTYGLASAIAWGAGDFSGGVATKKGNVLAVILFSQLVGLLLLLAVQWGLADTHPRWHHWLWGTLAGMSGTFGLTALYQGLAMGRMGVVAPISAVVTALIPIGVACLTQGLPKQTQMIGFLSAMAAVWLITATRGAGRIKRAEIILSLLAGTGFGLFFICIDRVSQEAILWPLIAARCASIGLLALVLIVGRQPVRPQRPQIVFIAMAGLLDTVGNACFALASQAGRLDVAAVLSSLYPVSTVLLACFFLKERLQVQHWIGLAAACAALTLIAL